MYSGGGGGSYANRSAQAYSNSGSGQVHNNGGGAPMYNNNNSGGSPQGYNLNNNNNVGGGQVFNSGGNGVGVQQQAYSNNNSGSSPQGYNLNNNNNVGGAQQQAYNNNSGGNGVGGQQQAYNNSNNQSYNNNNIGGDVQAYSPNNNNSQAYNNNGNNQAYGNSGVGVQAHSNININNNNGGTQPYNNSGGTQPYNNSGGAQTYSNNPNMNNNNGGVVDYSTQPIPPPPESVPPPPPPPMPYQPQQQQYGSPPQNPNTNTMVGRYQQNYPVNVKPIDTEAELQSLILNKSIARVQEASHYMRQAMERNDLPASLEKARAVLTELGDVKYNQANNNNNNNPYQDDAQPTAQRSTTLSPKNYYELHTLALQELPNLEEFLLSLFRQGSYSPYQLYEIVQYCPRAVPRLYLQICVASAWMRSEDKEEGEEDAPQQRQPQPDSPTLDRKWLLQDLKEAVRCVQCPIRGLFLRYYLLQALRDKLPDRTTEQNRSDVAAPVPEPVPVPAPVVAPAPSQNVPVKEEEGHIMSNSAKLGDLLQNTSSSGGFLNDEEDIHGRMENINIDDPPVPTPVPTTSNNTNNSNDSLTNPNSATVQDSYEFILSNLIEMNKLWVRIQHMPGDQRSKEARKKRERERNELRVLVGTNIVRLSELDEVTSTIYGTVVLPRILDQIVACRDPLAQAYLMDCMIQVFPDEFHIQTLEVILGVCPRLREKVNIRTILQGIMDRLATYYADECLLDDEEDTEGVKTSVMLDTFEMFDDCIASVLEAKASRVTAREIVRLESSLLDFSLRCYPGRMDHVDRCLGVCAAGLRRSGGGGGGGLESISVKDLKKLLSLWIIGWRWR